MYGKQINKYMVLYWRMASLHLSTSQNLPSTPPEGKKLAVHSVSESTVSPSRATSRSAGRWIPSLRGHSRSSKLDTVLEHNMIVTISFSQLLSIRFHIFRTHVLVSNRLRLELDEYRYSLDSLLAQRESSAQSFKSLRNISTF